MSEKKTKNRRIPKSSSTALLKWVVSHNSITYIFVFIDKIQNRNTIHEATCFVFNNIHCFNRNENFMFSRVPFSLLFPSKTIFLHVITIKPPLLIRSCSLTFGRFFIGERENRTFCYHESEERRTRYKHF